MAAKLTVLCILATMIALSAAHTQTRRLPYESLLRAVGERLYHVSVGIGEDYPEETTTRETVLGDMEFLKRTGMNPLRITFGWDGIETAKGKYNWEFWDDYVKRAVDEYGLTLVPYICYTPRWNSTGDTTNYWNHTPVDYEEFGTFVEALVTRYKDRIKTWELWNEPDIKEFWSGSAEDLARLTKIGARAVRKADPTAKIVLAGLAGHTEFTLALFRDYGISPYVDIVNCHSYFETWSPNPLEAVVPYVNRIAGIIRQYGNNQSLWMAEVGYSTYRKPDGYVSNQYHCTYGYEHTPAYQAVALWKTLTLLLSTEKIAAVTWYRIRDLPEGEVVIGDVNNTHLGLDFLGFKPKPAERAVTFFKSFFQGKYRCIDDATVVRRTISSESEVHSFAMEDGTLAVVAWLKTGREVNPLEGTPGNLADGRTDVISLEIPGNAVRNGTLFDELGNSRKFTAFQAEKGKVAIDPLEVSGGRIVILKLSK
jgi:hypothetical protein